MVVVMVDDAEGKVAQEKRKMMMIDAVNEVEGPACPVSASGTELSPLSLFFKVLFSPLLLQQLDSNANAFPPPIKLFSFFHRRGTVQTEN